jgi:hypothetical protein
MKTVAAVIAGYLAWTVLWLAGNAGLAAAGLTSKDTSQPITSFTALMCLLALSVACSLLGGYAAQWISPTECKRAAKVTALLLLITGVLVQWSLLQIMPLWYHAGFLALLVPMTLAGAGRCKNTSAPAPQLAGATN